jgi:hypothetical protein
VIVDESSSGCSPEEEPQTSDSMKSALPGSLFYKTGKGAQTGDLYMSLIHTCELNVANPFEYLTELQKHGEELAQNPAAWMPWNYRQTLQRTVAALASGETTPPAV